MPYYIRALGFRRQITVLIFVLFLTELARARPESALSARHVQRPGDLRESYNFIIVGGGTAGLALADRLTESKKHTVLVVEYGQFANTSDPSTIGQRMSMIPSVPQTKLQNRVTNINVGYCVGGSSAINGMAVMRGSKRDYDIWVELGNKGSTWTWKGLLPYFKKAIHFVPPDLVLAADFNITYDLDVWGQYRDTRVYASYPGGLNSSISLDIVRDGHAGTHGVFYYPLSVDPKTRDRSYSRTGHWDGLNRPNYDIITGSRVNKILFDKQNTATGVQFVPTNGSSSFPTTLKAKKEVILSAGAIHTPQILHLSGIGPASLLRKAKITVRVDLPGVGANFQDHPIGPRVTFTYGTQPRLEPINSTLPQSEGKGQGLVAFLNLRTVVPKSFPAIARRYASQSPSAYLPANTAREVIGGYKAQQAILAREMADPNSKTAFLNHIIPALAPGGQPINLHITSRGTVSINTTHPDSAEPVIDYRALSNPTDMDVMLSFISFLRRFWLEGELGRKYRVTEVSPGANVTGEEDLKEFTRGGYSPQGWHPVGTAAKMRRELGGVVDDELRVYGTKRLRIVDASIMPLLIGGTTQLRP
ncbi:hypothetical protein QBC37DRAFT_454746 [Rhypophila decipiens]|uniref:Glucose-methanol-choline oxidoreductase N-terminal domain-containing protein n=1 Tax=Rhypophila decipiens TaxID=261697 RepID=A0AAN7B2P2_9PEZI|nr:hypothetical protein QBC37DRAFT_454746 [Rhypophila decipiens]